MGQTALTRAKYGDRPPAYMQLARLSPYFIIFSSLFLPKPPSPPFCPPSALLLSVAFFSLAQELCQVDAPASSSSSGPRAVAHTTRWCSTYTQASSQHGLDGPEMWLHIRFLVRRLGRVDLGWMRENGSLLCPGKGQVLAGLR